MSFRGGPWVRSVDGMTGEVTLDGTYVSRAGGTTTPQQPLTYINVRDYGAVGDDVTDDTAAIDAAHDDCPEGGELFFPFGKYRRSGPFIPRRNRTYSGMHAPRWSYRGGSPCCIKPHPTFAGTAILDVLDKEITGEAADNDGGRIFNLAVDGNSFGANLIGIRFHGLVRDWHIKDVDVSQTSGNGWVTDGYQRLDGNTYYPRGFLMESPTCYSAGNTGGAGNGFVLNSLTDSTIVDLLAVSCESIGALIDSPGDTKLIAPRFVFNKSDGCRITGNVSIGGLQVDVPTTDRNGAYGMKITATGTQPITITSPINRRDGATTPGAAGIGVIGTANNKVCPVIMTGVIQTVGFDDGGGGTESPDYGIRAEYAQFVQVTGAAWGLTAGFYDNGNVDVLDIARLWRRSTHAGTADTARVSAQPVVAALANNGAGAPAPVLAADADDQRGSLTFGSGTAPTTGAQVSVTFARPYAKAPVVMVVPTNGPAASRAPYPATVTAAGFNINLNVAATASQANTTYGVAYTVTP